MFAKSICKSKVWKQVQKIVAELDAIIALIQSESNVGNNDLGG